MQAQAQLRHNLAEHAPALAERRDWGALYSLPAQLPAGALVGCVSVRWARPQLPQHAEGFERRPDACRQPPSLTPAQATCERRQVR